MLTQNWYHFGGRAMVEFVGGSARGHSVDLELKWIKNSHNKQ